VLRLKKREKKGKERGNVIVMGRGERRQVADGAVTFFDVLFLTSFGKERKKGRREVGGLEKKQNEKFF